MVYAQFCRQGVHYRQPWGRMSTPGMFTDATALQQARWGAQRDRCGWVGILRGDECLLDAPEGRSEALLAEYQVAAEQRYGEPVASDLRQSCRVRIAAKPA